MDAYEKIHVETVRATFCAGHIPNVNAVAHRFCSCIVIRLSLLQGVFRPLRSRGSTYEY